MNELRRVFSSASVDQTAAAVKHDAGNETRLPVSIMWSSCVCLCVGCSSGARRGLLDFSVLSVRGDRPAHLPHQHPQLPPAAA